MTSNIGAWTLRDCQLWVIRAQSVYVQEREILKTATESRKNGFNFVYGKIIMYWPSNGIYKQTIHTREGERSCVWVKHKSHINWLQHCYYLLFSAYPYYTHTHTDYLVTFSPEEMCQTQLNKHTSTNVAKKSASFNEHVCANIIVEIKWTQTTKKWHIQIENDIIHCLFP